MTNVQTAKARRREGSHEGVNQQYILRAFSSRHRAFAVSLFCLVFAGCCPTKAPTKPRYDGPTLSLPALVSQINQNNSRIKTLWASGSFDVWVQNEKKQTEHIDGDKLTLVYRKPNELKMAGEKFGAPDRLFDVGSNGKQFWMWFPIKETMWWGEYHEDSPMSYGEIPIRPDLLIEVLGVNDLNPDLLKAPVPAMRFNNDEDAYMIDFHIVLDDRMVVEKEVWYDRKMFLPRSVMFYDPNGRMILQADLSEYANLNDDKTGPKIATRYTLQFLQTHAKLVLKLREARDRYKNIPNDRTFRFPGPDSAAKAYKVDEPAAQQPLQ